MSLACNDSSVSFYMKFRMVPPVLGSRFYANLVIIYKKTSGDSAGINLNVLRSGYVTSRVESGYEADCSGPGSESKDRYFLTEPIYQEFHLKRMSWKKNTRKIFFVKSFSARTYHT
jgi:hypothetical protein